MDSIIKAQHLISFLVFFVIFGANAFLRELRKETDEREKENRTIIDV